MRRRWILTLVSLGLLIILGTAILSRRANARIAQPTRSLAPLESPTNSTASMPVFPTFTGTANRTSSPTMASQIHTPLDSTPTQTMQPTYLNPPLLMVVELQPESPTPGGQIVWILNPSNEELDLGCWALHSATRGLTVTVEPDLHVPAGATARLVPDESWLGKIDQIQLLDPSHNIIDQTPELRDEVFDDQIWFRNSNGEWQFGRTQINATVIQGHLLKQTPPGC